MAHLEFEQWVPFPLERVFLFFANPENLPRIMPPATGTRIVQARLAAPPSIYGKASPDQPIAGEGSQIVTSFRALPFLPLRMSWTASIVEFKWNGCFADDQSQGPFKRFRHRHHFLRSDRNGIEGTIVHDVIDYDAGFGVFGLLAERFFVSRMLKGVFEFANVRWRGCWGEAAGLDLFVEKLRLWAAGNDKERVQAYNRGSRNPARRL